MDLFRWIVSRLFGIRWVVLIDSDGKENIRRIRWERGRATAERIGSRIKRVHLLDNGKIANGGYVKRWEPYTPLAPKVWPKWNEF